MADLFKRSMTTMPDWWDKRTNRKMYRRIARRRMRSALRCTWTA